MPAPTQSPPQRRAGSGRGERIDLLVDAATGELRDHGYDAFTVRQAARRAGIAPATAYTYFSSKEHLVAEVCWRILQTLEPPPTTGDTATRLAAAVGALADLIASEPEVAAGSTAAVLATDPDVQRLRMSIAALVNDHFTAALGDDADDARVLTLDLALFGALHNASIGLLDFADLRSVLLAVAGVIVGPPRP